MILNKTWKHLAISFVFMISFTTIFSACSESDSKSSQISKLIKQLESNDPAVSKEARTKLVKIGKEAIPQVLEALKHEDWKVRALSVGVLVLMGPIDNHQTIPAIKDLLGDENKSVRQVSEVGIEQLELDAKLKGLTSKTKYGDSVEEQTSKVSYYVNQLVSLDDSIARKAKDELLKIENEAVPELIKALKHQDPRVRIRVALFLSEFGSNQNNKISIALLDTLQDKNPHVRKSAETTMEIIKLRSKNGKVSNKDLEKILNSKLAEVKQ